MSKCHMVANLTYADPGKFARGGPSLTIFLSFFLVDEGKKDQNTNISGPPSARQRNDI